MFESRSSLRANALHLSLLASLGLFASACGGSVVTTGEPSNGDGNAGGSNEGGSNAGGSVAGGSNDAGSGATSMGTAGSVGSGGRGPGPFDCTMPADDGFITGFVGCPQGIPHRASVVTCQVTTAAEDPPVDPPAKVGDACFSMFGSNHA